MPLQIIRDNIVHMQTDAIVNAANAMLQPGGGVCGSIFDAAGFANMKKACDTIGSCPVGHAVITAGFALPAKYVIHAVGPVWMGGGQNEEDNLRAAYRAALTLAKEHHLESIAFPIISSGIFGYPKAEAFSVAVSEISSFLTHEEMSVYLVVYDAASFNLSQNLFHSVQSYIDQNYVDARAEYGHLQPLVMQSYMAERRLAEESKCKAAPAPKRKKSSEREESKPPRKEPKRLYEEDREAQPLVRESTSAPKEEAHFYGILAKPTARPSVIPKAPPLRSLEDVLDEIEESFSETLLRLIDQKGKTDVDVYKKANIDRKHFSKIRSNKDYKPTKNTVFAFAIALELSLDEAKDLLSRAGYAFSHANKFDLIIEYFFTKRNYDIFEINETLFAFGQPQLGC